jgi:integrase
MANEWLMTHEAEGVRPITIRGYRLALNPACEALGHKRIQTIDSADVRAIMRTSQNKPKATNRLTSYTVQGMFELALDDELVRTNPARRVKPTGRDATVREELTAQDAALIQAHVEGGRLEVCWLLTLAGLRRSEALGLRWSDLTDTAVTIERGRTDIDPTVTTPTKSNRGNRVIPLSPHIVAATKRTRAARKREVLALGRKCSESAYIAVDKALEPLRPDVYSDE